MFEYLVDLFVCLNLAVKNQSFMDLDDFLYFFDNLSFFIKGDETFQKMTIECFNWYIFNYEPSPGFSG